VGNATSTTQTEGRTESSLEGKYKNTIVLGGSNFAAQQNLSSTSASTGSRSYLIKIYQKYG
jgi:hypothetical protein